MCGENIVSILFNIPWYVLLLHLLLWYRPAFHTLHIVTSDPYGFILVLHILGLYKYKCIVETQKPRKICYPSRKSKWFFCIILADNFISFHVEYENITKSHSFNFSRIHVVERIFIFLTLHLYYHLLILFIFSKRISFRNCFLTKFYMKVQYLYILHLIIKWKIYKLNILWNKLSAYIYTKIIHIWSCRQNITQLSILNRQIYPFFGWHYKIYYSHCNFYYPYSKYYHSLIKTRNLT